MFRKHLAAAVLSLPLLAGCSQQMLFNKNPMVAEATVTDRTRASEILVSLPAPVQKVPVVVYDFQDQTGQFKNNDKYTDYSSAVTKGGHAILIKALMDAGNEQWFDVAERGALKDLLQERQIVKLMRSQYYASDGVTRLPNLPPLLYGGLLLEGGIVSYDSDVVTGGAGATYLGVGGNAQYRRDVVTVYLRAVNVQTGRVQLAVNSAKTVFSTSVNATLLKYFTFDRLLQAEVGFSATEPTQLAVRQAIETAVYSMIMEGALRHLWEFQDRVAGEKAIEDYLIRRDGTASANAQNMETASAPAGNAPNHNSGGGTVLNQ
ncbi:MAG: curli production assembly protein CsgG [Alphaproteobacteria bacterium]|nr:curli production assembly protein CsgG [Alphaproteobacteria bacterium]